MKSPLFSLSLFLSQAEGGRAVRLQGPPCFARLHAHGRSYDRVRRFDRGACGVGGVMMKKKRDIFLFSFLDRSFSSPTFL